MRHAFFASLFVAVAAGCPSGEPPPLATAPARSLTFTSPTPGEVENPVAFTVTGHDDIAWVRYVADNFYTLGTNDDVGGGFPFGMDFAVLGDHTMTAVGFDAEGDIVAEDTIAIHVLPDPTELNELGIWLEDEDLADAGYSHAAMAVRLAASGIKRTYLPVGVGAPDCSADPVLCDREATDTFRAVGVESWAWMRATADQDGAEQAETIREAVPAGYHGLVIDLDPGFDADPDAVETLLAAMLFVRSQCDTTGLHLGGNFPLYLSTEGTPFARQIPVSRLDHAVDGYMPRLDLSTATPEQLADPSAWMESLLCAWQSEGATKGVHHVLRGSGPTSQDGSTLDALIALAGREASVFGAPPLAEEADWDAMGSMDWWTGDFVAPDCGP